MSWTSGDVRLSAAAKRTTPPGIDSLALRRTFCPPRASFIRGLMLASPSLTQGGSRMPESGPFGSVRGVCSNAHPYRDMDRRAFITGVAFGVVSAPLTLRGQQAKRVYLIGYLRVGAVPIPKPFWEAMREFGWVEGQNLKLDSRYAPKADQLPTLAAELVRLKVDLILTVGTPATQTANHATRTIPIVFAVADDPVDSCVVATLARPGGNLTGFVLGRYDEKLL